VKRLLRNDGVDRLVSVIDCEGASAHNVQRFYSLLRNVPVALNKVILRGSDWLIVVAALSWPAVQSIYGERTCHHDLGSRADQEVSASNYKREDFRLWPQSEQPVSRVVRNC